MYGKQKYTFILFLNSLLLIFTLPCSLLLSVCILLVERPPDDHPPDLGCARSDLIQFSTIHTTISSQLTSKSLDKTRRQRKGGRWGET